MNAMIKKYMEYMEKINGGGVKLYFMRWMASGII